MTGAQEDHTWIGKDLDLLQIAYHVREVLFWRHESQHIVHFEAEFLLQFLTKLHLKKQGHSATKFPLTLRDSDDFI